MRSLFPALLCALLAVPAAAQVQAGLPGLEDLPEPARYLAGYVSAGGGLAFPFGGHWGDRGDGFKPSAVYSLSASRRLDEIVSYGLESSSSPRHGHRAMKDMRLGIFAFTPFIKISSPELDKTYYGVLGAGLYQWTQPAFTSGGVRFGSDSGSSAGINIGGGVSYPFWRGTMIGLDLRWHHILNMKGANFDLNSADNLNVMLVLHYGVWKNKRQALTSQ